MKVLVILLVLTLSVTVPASFAQQTADCTFGGMATPMTEKFAKDLAAKAFVEKYPNASRNIPVDEAGNMQNRFILTGDGDVKEILEIQFHTDTNGCYIPASYVYSYDDGMIDLTIINSIGNFTEIMNFIKSDKIMIEDFYPENCNVIHINATMTNGEFYGACKSTNTKIITALASTDSESDLLMDIPLPMLYSIASTDCKITGEFETIVDNEFVSSEIVPTEKGHMVTVSLDEGFHKVEVLGFTILPDPSPEQYCGIVEGYDKKYLPPLAQINHNMKPTQIRCNEGLVLLQKYDGSPACVTESTKTKLIERGWTVKESDMKCDNNADFDLIRYSESEDIPPQRLVAFLKEGTTGVICLQYISNLDNEGFFDIDENLHQRNSSNEISSNVVLNAIPDKVSREYGTNVTVAYEIHAKNNSTGIYWINLSQLCDSLPVVVWDDEPRVSEDDIPARTGGYHCPNKVLDVSIIGYSGLDLQYHSAKPT